MIYKLPCCRSDRSHKTELYLQMQTKRKVWVWFGLFPVRQFTTGFQKSSLLWFFAGFCHAGKGIAAEHIVRQSSQLSMRIVLMYLPHRKRNCRWSYNFTFGLDYFLHDRLFPTDHQTLQHDEDLLVAGERRQVVDVHMDVDEAALHLYHTVVSLLCILLAMKSKSAVLKGLEKLTSRAMMARLEKLEGMSSFVRTQASPLSISAWGWIESFWKSNVDSCTWTWSHGCAWTRPTFSRRIQT